MPSPWTPRARTSGRTGAEGREPSPSIGASGALRGPEEPGERRRPNGWGGVSTPGRKRNRAGPWGGIRTGPRGGFHHNASQVVLLATAAPVALTRLSGKERATRHEVEGRAESTVPRMLTGCSGRTRRVLRGAVPVLSPFSECCRPDGRRWWGWPLARLVSVPHPDGLTRTGDPGKGRRIDRSVRSGSRGGGAYGIELARAARRL